MKHKSSHAPSSNGGVHRNAGGVPSYVEKGTIKDASYGSKGYRGINGQGKGPKVAQPKVQNTHSPKGGRTGKTAMKIARQNRGSREMP